MSEKYYSLKQSRLVYPQHEMSFEHHRMWEGKPGEYHPLQSPKRSFLESLNQARIGLVNRIVGKPVKTRTRRFRD